MTRTPLSGRAPRLPVTEARERLAESCDFARGGGKVILTRHGKPVAALVGMAWLDRFHRVRDQDADSAEGWVPIGLQLDADRCLSVPEAAVRLRQVQLDRSAERRLLAQAGLEPIPGGEIAAPVARVEPEPVAVKKKRWDPWWWRTEW